MRNEVERAITFKISDRIIIHKRVLVTGIIIFVELQLLVPRVVSSSWIGVDPFRYWLLGTLCRSDCGWLVVMNGGIQ